MSSNTSVVPANSSVEQQLPLAALWHGYMVASKVEGTAGVSLTAAGGINSAQPGRFVGALGHNSVVGGLLLHTTRKRLARNCDGESLLQLKEILAGCCDRLYMGTGGHMHGIG